MQSNSGNFVSRHKMLILAVILFLVLAVLVVLTFISFQANSVVQDSSAGDESSSTSPSTTTSSANVDTSASWSFDGMYWQATGEPPICPEPITMGAPVSLNNVTGILYPGQIRGSYKPHGGFRFDDALDNKVDVRAPIDGIVVRAARYFENGDLQYLIDVVNSCGIMYRFDHLAELTPKFQAIMDGLPQPQDGDSRTNFVNPPVSVPEGELIATAVGMSARGLNVSFDWGVYDLRDMNQASQNADWLADHPGELAPYAVCWLDWLSSQDETVVRNLPPGDPRSGKTSDYCK